MDRNVTKQYRCSIPLSNFDPFYDVVGIDSDSPLYLSPDDRVTIW